MGVEGKEESLDGTKYDPNICTVRGALPTYTVQKFDANASCVLTAGSALSRERKKVAF
jgi:hypothetical protein